MKEIMGFRKAVAFSGKSVMRSKETSNLDRRRCHRLERPSFTLR
jgi:hypothetical protein